MKVATQNFSLKGLGLIILFYISMHSMVKNTLNRTLKLSSTEIGPCMRTHMVDWRWAGSHSSTQFWNRNAYNECMQAGRRNARRDRLTMGRQSEINWQREEWRPGRHAGRSYGALIPLLGGITPELLLFLHRMPLFIHLSWLLGSHIRESLHIPNIYNNV